MGYSRTQIAVLLSQTGVLSFSFECIFPFVNQFLVEIGVVDDPADVGFYSGIVESTFSITSLLAVFPLAWAADRYGRKPVIVLGALGVFISLTMFGLSKTYGTLILSRIIGGVVGGSMTAIRVMASELADKDTETYIFNGIVMAYRIGQIIGQPVGGILAHPEIGFPSLFGGPFWREYPYALPCFVGAGYALVLAIMGAIVLRETLPSRRATPELPKITEAGEATPLLAEREVNAPGTAVGDGVSITQESASPSIRSVLTYPLFSLLLSNIFMVLLNEIFFALYPLFAYTAIELGGLGLNSAQIGQHMSFRALLHLLALVPCAAAQRKWGKLSVYRFSLSVWIPTLFCFPLLNWMARRGLEGSPQWYAMLFLLWSIWSITGWTWSAIFLLASEHSPSAEAVSIVQGLVSSSIIAPQAVAPALGTSAFTLSIKHPEILNGNAFWVASLALGKLPISWTYSSLKADARILVAIVVFVHSLTLQESKYDWRAHVEQDNRETPEA
ncbi:MFS general substrate transporter [Serendipita vermifera]|nr:MFS general substrate transporter [Serendipita vermifera]